MNKNTIEYLAYLLDKAHKEEGREKAIIFLGAGTSVSAGIPLTYTIVRHIKIKFYNNPIIKKCIKTKNDDYYSLMGALTADERRDLFHFYVTREKVKLNIANIYLAQLLKLGYVDYIVTVNFDDLILKACTLYNFLPPVYDISNIKTITTTDIRKNSVIYLHGQYFGQWLLNNPDELQKVEEEVLSLFNAIKTRRTWIIIGYSGNDGIFNKIKSLGSFSSELFWVKKKLDAKHDEKIINFLQADNLNANRIEGYYADSFFLKLHAELSKLNENLEAPEIISKPFTFVKSVLQSINEIKEDDELNDNVKKMVINCNERIDKAIAQYEEEGTEENLKQKIVDSTLKGIFNSYLAQNFEKEITENNYVEANIQLSTYYNGWGSLLFDKANNKIEHLDLYYESIRKYEKASQLNPKNASAFNNWGAALSNIGRLQNDKNLLLLGLEKFKKSIEIDPNMHKAYANFGLTLYDLGTETKNAEMLEQSIEKFKKALKFDHGNSEILNNWGNSLIELSKIKNDIDLVKEGIKKFDEALDLSPKNVKILSNKGGALFELGKRLNDKRFYEEGLNILRDTYNINGESYNLSCAYALLSDKENALKYLKETLDKKFVTVKQVNEDDDWEVYKNDEEFITLLNQYK